MRTSEIPAQIIHALDEYLWRHGFKEARVRGIARRGWLVSAFALLVGLPLALLTPLLFWFGVGSLLAVWNFCALARWLARLLPSGWSSGTLAALLIHTNIRLFITGICLYISIVKCEASPFALLVGLTVIVFDVTLTGLWTLVRKSGSRSTTSSLASAPASDPVSAPVTNPASNPVTAASTAPKPASAEHTAAAASAFVRPHKDDNGQ